MDLSPVPPLVIIALWMFWMAAWYWVSMCGRKHHTGMTCTKRWLHRGPHIAHGDAHQVLATWR